MSSTSLIRTAVFGLASAGLIAAALTGGLVAQASARFRPAAAPRYTFSQFQYPHDTFTQLLGINNGDRIAGYHGMNMNKGFKFRLPNNVQNWNFPGSAQTQVIGINNNGDTVGFYVDKHGTFHGFFQNHKNDTDWKTVDVPGTTFNQLLGVNDHRTAAGYYQYGKNNIFQPYTWSVDGTFTLLPIYNAQATDINNTGWVTGFQMVSSSASRAFLDKGGAIRYFDYPGSTSTQALGINRYGLVVGTYNDKKGNTHGFTYKLGTGIFRSVDVPGASSTVVNGVNDNGWIVGFDMMGKNTIGFAGRPK